MTSRPTAIEVQRDGVPVRGYTLNESDPIQGNVINPGAVASWGDGQRASL